MRNDAELQSRNEFYDTKFCKHQQQAPQRPAFSASNHDLNCQGFG